MSEQHPLVPAVYDGWHTYQNALIEAIRPLTAEQLRLRATPDLRTVGEIATHMIRTRAGWFVLDLEEQDETLREIIDRPWADEPPLTAAELVAGLETTWDILQAIMANWTAEQWSKTFTAVDDYGEWPFSRAWVVWHLIEHDLHHGGEISLTLGIHGVKAPDI